MKARKFLPVLALAATCAFAQQPNRQPNSAPPSNNPAESQAAPGQPGSGTDAQTPVAPADANSTTIHGCLGSGANNTYTVTEDKGGAVYTLVGKDFSSLSSHVGQEVEADGAPASAASGNSSASAANNATTASATDFQVTHMRKVGDKCANPPKPSSSLETYSPVLMAAVYAPQTTGSAPGAQTAQPGTSSPGSSAAAGTTGMSTSPQTQTTTPGQSTPSTATPTTPPPTSPGSVNDSTPGTQTTPGTSATGSAATGSSKSTATPGTQPPCAATSTTPCSTPGTVPSATPGTSTPQTPPPTASAPDTTATPNAVNPPQK